MGFAAVAELRPAADLVVHEEGWQSWSPSGTYPAAATSPRPPHPDRRVMGFRPDREPPASGFQGEGLLAAGPRGGGAVRIWSAPDPGREVPSIRAGVVGDRLVVLADGRVEETVIEAPTMEAALARWADAVARRHGLPPVGSVPPVWCSWYHYLASVTAADVLENLYAAGALGIPVGVVQIDDGFQREVGDWLEAAPRFRRSVERVAAEIRAAGMRAGIWIAPFLAGERSRLLLEHPDWMIVGADAGRNWGQRPRVLDVTHPAAAEWLAAVLRELASWGFDYFKLDFLYAGALPGRRHQDASPLDAYRHGLRLVREAVGNAATLVGCGAPILPSLGLVDAMRVGPDIALHAEPLGGVDLSAPSRRGATLAVRARAFLHGRFWVNDPDCIVARPEMEGRRDWARVVGRWGGLRASGDRLSALDGWGLETTRRLLVPSSPEPLVAS
jgi:alpha-galactosidase